MGFPLLQFAIVLVGLWAVLWLGRTLRAMLQAQRDAHTTLRDLEARLEVLERERDQRRIT